MPFHQALYDVKAWKVEINSVWLALLLSRSPKVDAQSGSDDGTLSLGEINAVLRVMEKKVLPYLTKPQLLADWLIDCIDVGSSTALLAMSPLYQLFTRYSLSLPSLYTTLYRLLTPSLATGCLAGITRELVLEVCEATETEDLTLADLATADEAFLTSSTRDVQPIATVDGVALPAAPDPVTTAAARAFAVATLDRSTPSTVHP